MISAASSIEEHLSNGENENPVESTKQLSSSIADDSANLDCESIKNEFCNYPNMPPSILRNGSTFVGLTPSNKTEEMNIISKCFSLCNIPLVKLDPRNCSHSLSILSEGIGEMIKNNDKNHFIEKKKHLQETQSLESIIEALKEQNTTKLSIEDFEKLQKPIDSIRKEKEKLEKLLFSKDFELASIDAILKRAESGNNSGTKRIELKVNSTKVKELENSAVEIKSACGDNNRALMEAGNTMIQTSQLDNAEPDKMDERHMKTADKMNLDRVRYRKEKENKSNELKRKCEQLQNNKAEIDFLQDELKSVREENCSMKETFVAVEKEDLHVRLENAVLERKLQEAEERNVHLQTETAETWNGLEKMQEDIEKLRMKNNEIIFQRALIDQLKSESGSLKLTFKNLQEEHEQLQMDFNNLKLSNSKLLKFNGRLDESRRSAEKSLSKLEHVVLDMNRQEKGVRADMECLREQLKCSVDTVELLQKANAISEGRPRELQCRLDRLQSRNFEIVAKLDTKEREIRQVYSKMDQLSYLFSLTNGPSKSEFLNRGTEVEHFHSKWHRGDMRKRDFFLSLVSRKGIIKDYWTNINQGVY
ncbi:hypothetical protein ZYGR_0AL01700 [Zygosaccharomyces rouxii]|uniref:Uncharacterized protein n=1 Tax=Zygosaccharomyces rouxii TaxID=4956 RepID=A0A1Q3AFG2_ZYGRO|nr:hypothetical protein ZYGR_0AL01700 [Zygosaccharomyces rouxii]